MDKALIRDDLKRDEGVLLKPYTDTAGKLTIGVGRNLTDSGISEVEAEILLADDIERVCAQLDEYAPWWRNCPEPVQRGLVNVCFNQGARHFIDKNPMTMAWLHSGDYVAAGDELLNGPYRAQVGERAVRISKLWKSAAQGAVANA